MSVSTTNNTHIAANNLGGVLMHNPDLGNTSNGGVATSTDTTASDANSSSAQAKGTPNSQGKVVQVTVAGSVRFSNPS
jgi:hypothetical protein